MHDAEGYLLQRHPHGRRSGYESGKFSCFRTAQNTFGAVSDSEENHIREPPFFILGFECQTKISKTRRLVCILQ